MVKRFVVPFAATGDKSVTPDGTAADGSISYSQGWPVAYQLPDTDPLYRPVGRAEMNGVLNDITGALNELQVLGLSEWVAVTGLVVPYRINALVRYQNVNYRSTVDNNSDTPGTSLKWRVDGPKTVKFANRFQTAGSGNFTVPAGVYSLYYRLWGGGGGGGGGGGTSAGNAGGAGGYSEGWIDVVPGQVIPYTVGAGGTGGTTAGGGTAGVSGGSSSFNSTITCTPGIAGAGGGTGGGTAGAGSGGDLNMSGTSGSGPAGLQQGTLYLGPPGGGGYGVGPSVYGYSTSVTPGRAPSGGGHGGVGSSTGAAQVGGAGQPGALYLWGF